MGVSPENAPDKPTYVKIHFEKGVPTSVDGEKMIETYFGAQIKFDITVLDKNGQPVPGTLSYATRDLDTVSHQDRWGRPGGIAEANKATSLFASDADYNFASDPYLYAEGLTINFGSQSYAVVPNYDHANATTAATGQLVSSKVDPSITHPLHIEDTGTSTAHADGVKFS